MAGREQIRSFVARLALALKPTVLSAAAQDLVTAHGAMESGWGSAVASRVGHNHWNLCAGSKWTGDIIPGPDKEPDGKGGWRKIAQRFRCYPSDRAATVGYLAFLSANYPRSYAALVAGDIDGFVLGLRDDPGTPVHERDYFTADPVPYLRDLTGCLAIVRHALRPVPGGVA